MTARDRRHEHRGRLAAFARPPYDGIARHDGVHRERADAEDVVPAHEQRGTEHGLTGRAQPGRELAHGVAHLPAARGPDRRADRGLDTVRRADPIGERDVPRPVGRRPVVGSPKRAGDGGHRDRPPRPALAGPSQHPFEHEVRHERRWDDVVLGLVRSRPRGPAQLGGEVGAPVAGHEPPIGRFAQLGAGPARWIPVHHHDAPIVGPAPRFRLRELAGVERAVATTADHDDIAHDDHAGQTSPATDRISPVTAPAASLARNSTAFTTWSSSTQCTLASFTWARLAAVFTMPGATAFTRTLRSASSRARARVSPATAALAALYDAMWRWGLSTATDAKFTIAPPPRSSSAGIAACETRNAVSRLTATSRSSCSGRTSSTGPKLRRPPATFTTTSRPPNAVGVVLERVIRPGDRPVGIGQQGKIEAQLGGVAEVSVHPGGVHAEGLDAGSLELGHLVAHGGELAVSPRSVVARVEHERDVLRLEDCGEGVRLAVGRLGLERRGLAADR